MVVRLEGALDGLARTLRQSDGVVALVLFGSYARGDFGRKSDVDLLALVCPSQGLPLETLRSAVVRAALEAECDHHLPMHLAPLVADAPGELGPELLHAVSSEGIVLFAEAAALAALQPSGLAPWILVRFTTASLPAHRAVRLSRRLHGREGRSGLVVRPAVELGRGSLLVPAPQVEALREALDEAGATYDLIPVWRSV